MQVDNGIRREHRALAKRYEALQHACAGDPQRFAARWTRIARAQRFDDLNELIRRHNAWYPIERDLPMNPRTGEYIVAHGRDFRRRELDAEWILENFPA